MVLDEKIWVGCRFLFESFKLLMFRIYLLDLFNYLIGLLEIKRIKVIVE